MTMIDNELSDINSIDGELSKINSETSTLRSAVLSRSYALKNYGKLVSEKQYFDYYNIDFDESGKHLQVGYIKGGVKLTENLGNFNSVTYTSEISLPFMFDVSNPESIENKGRFKHATQIRDFLLEMDLTEVKIIANEELEHIKKGK